MNLLIIILLFAISLVLFLVEIFLIPGTGLAGIGAAIGVIIANVLTFTEMGTTAGLCVLGASVVICLLLIYWMMHSRTLDHVSLRGSISSTSATREQLSIHSGDTGRALSRLALIGNAEIGGKTVEVRSVDGFLPEGTPIVVTSVSQALILVKRKDS